jgi:C-terminal processing protease CtpA/Prc
MVADRCGIGCVLESNPTTGGVYMSKIIRGGTAEKTHLEEGDEIMNVVSECNIVS